MTKRARSVWIDDEVWEEAGRKADKMERSISYLVTKLLREFVPPEVK